MGLRTTSTAWVSSFWLSQFPGRVTIQQALERSRAGLREREETRELRERYSTLSPREAEVMMLVITGLLNTQVGAELGISEITVKAHRGRVMQKMKAGSFADL